MHLRQATARHLKRVFRAFGLDVRAVRFAPGTNMTRCLEVARAKGLSPRTVVDVGVAYGTPELYDAFPDARYLLVEALSEWEPVLQSLCERLDAEYVIAAAGREVGSITINVPEVLSWAAAGGAGEPRAVPVTTIDEEIAKRDFKGPFLLKVDVEGAEASVLAGATETLRDTEMVIAETNVSSTLPEIISLMRENGFVPHDLFGHHYRTPDMVLVQVDVAFVREDSALRLGEYEVHDKVVSGFLEDQQAVIDAARARR